jgi:hypothetical protein
MLMKSTVTSGGRRLRPAQPSLLLTAPTRYDDGMVHNIFLDTETDLGGNLTGPDEIVSLGVLLR